MVARAQTAGAEDVARARTAGLSATPRRSGPPRTPPQRRSSTRPADARRATRSTSARQSQVQMLSYFPRMPYRAPGAPEPPRPKVLSGKPIRYYRPKGSQEVRHLVDEGFQAFNAARLSEACAIFSEKMLAPEQDTTIGLTMAGALTPAGLGGCVIEMMERGLVDFIISTGANLYHDLHYALNFTLRRGSPFARRRAAVRGRGDSDLRRPLSRDRAARDRRVHPGLHRALRSRRADDDVGVSLPSGPRPARAVSRLRGAFGAWRAPRRPACRSTRRRPGTAPSG